MIQAWDNREPHDDVAAMMAVFRPATQEIAVYFGEEAFVITVEEARQVVAVFTGALDVADRARAMATGGGR